MKVKLQFIKLKCNFTFILLFADIEFNILLI